MGDHVYKSTELTGSSKESVDDAVRTAIERASKTLRDIRWFEVTDVRGHVRDGKVAHWQVTVKVGFTLDD
ncbi:dodecin [Luteimonas lutimaris]|uniref:Dodecin family protein n=1 Tax=Luteimonas lutimaris TaxID=698645 RepID=A0ABP7M7F0_9GAMM